MKKRVDSLQLYSLIQTVSNNQHKQININDHVYPLMDRTSPLPVRNIEKLLYSLEFYG